jgi:hypothetical protein
MRLADRGKEDYMNKTEGMRTIFRVETAEKPHDSTDTLIIVLYGWVGSREWQYVVYSGENVVFDTGRHDPEVAGYRWGEVLAYVEGQRYTSYNRWGAHYLFAVRTRDARWFSAYVLPGDAMRPWRWMVFGQASVRIFDAYDDFIDWKRNESGRIVHEVYV